MTRLGFSVLAALARSAREELPVQRHVARWTEKPQRIPTDMMMDSPFVGNGDLGMTFGGDPWLTSFYLASNQFWSANVNPNTGPDAQSEESYTQVRIGDVQVFVPALSSPDVQYSASMELYDARVNGSYLGASCELKHSSVIDAEENLLLTSFEHNGGCGELVFQLGAGAGSGYRFGPPLPGASGQQDDTVWISRDSVTETKNSLALARCFNAGQHGGAQRWQLQDGSFSLADGRSIESGDRLSIGEAGFEELWQLLPQADPTELLLRSNKTGQCASPDVNGSFAVAVDCQDASAWKYNSSSQHLYPATGFDSWGLGGCLTAVEPNPLIKAAAALRLVGQGLQVQASSDGARFANLTVSLPTTPGAFTMVAGVVTKGACAGCDPDVSDPVAAAASLVTELGDVDALLSKHAAWWREYWATGARVDLGPEHRVLESFYYGMQYQIGSASRAGKFAPGLWGPWISADECGWSGDYTLNYNFQANYYGVFSDGRPELALPYFQTILNHVELGKWRASMAYWGDALQTTGTPGFAAQDFNRMSQLSTDGSGFVPAGYRGLQLPTHFSPWPHFYFGGDWGQKNVAAFTAKAFADFYDFTGNETFLRETAYPYLLLVGDFYESYMTRENGDYNVMHSCAMESCFFQGQGTDSNIQLSNNPPFDLAFVKRTFRKLLEYSQTLELDEARRPLWSDILGHLAPYPVTLDEDQNQVFAQATLNPTARSSGQTYGFPNASRCSVLNGGSEVSDCANARYPIVHLNAMHPAEDVDLESEAGLLQVAQQTVESLNFVNDYSPTNGICQAWPPSARVVSDAGKLLGHFEKALNDTMSTNFVPFILDRPTGGWGCTIEQSGATVAVNDLLASVHGHGDAATLRLLPGGWPQGQAVSFADVRVRGAFAVSASAVGTGAGATLADVTVRSLAGRPLTLRWTGPLVVTSNGQHVEAQDLGSGRFRFQTSAGASYKLASTALLV